MRTILTILICTIGLFACEKPREQGAKTKEISLQEVAIPLNDKPFVTELVAWERFGNCKKRNTLCHQDWDVFPSIEKDTCYPLIDSTPKAEFIVPKSAHMVYLVGMMSREKGLTNNNIEFDFGEGAIIDLLEVCP